MSPIPARSAPRAARLGLRELLRRLRREAAIQDRLFLVFLAYLALRVQLAPESAGAESARAIAIGLFGLCLLALLLTRGGLLPAGGFRALVYRIGVVIPIVGAYLQMQIYLPALRPSLLDRQLYGIDRALLGETPALWMQPWHSFATVEWFSFFYLLFVHEIALVILATLALDRGRRAVELVFGAALILVVGCVSYTLVPGAGPHATLVFEAPIQGGYWWAQVELMVETVGAQLDIFPSLHTALPVYFAIHAFAHRARHPYRWSWPILAFFALNMVVSTMFLRWHWAIDVIMGLLLALLARVLARLVSRSELFRGVGRDDRQPVWEPLHPWRP
ncbi:MAG: phosphatase PAP2 family protein [Myxococcales bacterium]|nr:phosphatase PAP2 family protein [Myxococcales bacterium]